MAKLIDGIGVVEKKGNFTLVKKVVNAGDEIARHNHPEANVIFTVVKGRVEVHINDDEVFNVVPGKAVSFDGDNYLSAKIIEDSEVFVTLILK